MFKKIVLSLLLVSLLMSVCVYASTELKVNVSYNPETRVVTVKGEAAGNVSLTLVKNGEETKDIDDGSVTPLYFKVVKVNGEMFTHTFRLPESAPSGKYILWAASGSEKASITLMKSNSDIPAEIFSQLNNASSSNEYRSIVETNAVDFGIDLDSPNYAEIADKTFEIMYASGRDYDNGNAIASDYYVFAALADLVLNSENGKSLLTVYADVLGLNDSDIDDARISDDIWEEIFEQIENNDWGKIFSKTSLSVKEAFYDEFIKMRTLAAVKTCETRAQLQNVMTDLFADDFPYVEENKRFGKLKNPENVFAEMIKKSYSDLDDIQSAFEKAVDNVYDDENSSSGGSSSGKKPSSSGSSVSVPANTTVTPPVVLRTLFKDIDGVTWAKDAIETLFEKGIISGRSETVFAPNDYVTRAEFAKMVVLAFGLEPYDNHPFKDIKDSWSAPYVGAAYDSGIITGVSEESFAPNEKITREAAAVIIARAIGVDIEEGNTSFTDDSAISDWAKVGVSFLAGKGIISGREGNLFAPLDNITRAEAAVLINRINTEI